MPVQKRYFHCSQEIIADPEVWDMMKNFGDRSILTWLQILIYLERTDNQWRTVGDWLAILSRTVRQSSANISRQIGWMVEKGWLTVAETSADGSPLLLKGSNWLKYNKTRETKKQIINSQVGNLKTEVTLPSVPFRSVPFPSVPYQGKEEDKKEKKEKNYGHVKTQPVAAKSSLVWNAYAIAYKKRYGVDPVRNQQVNSLMCKLVDKLGQDEAASVASFYVTHNDPFYVKDRHPVNLLVLKAEGLRTQWATGIKSTSSELRQAELKDDAREQVKRVEAMLKGGL